MILMAWCFLKDNIIYFISIIRTMIAGTVCTACCRDPIHWKSLEPALVPDMTYDNDKNGGCFSGSVVVHDNQLFLFYTGRTEDETGIFETQNLAVSKDGRHFVKIEENPLINEVPEKEEEIFEIPRCFCAREMENDLRRIH